MISFFVIILHIQEYIMDVLECT